MKGHGALRFIWNRVRKPAGLSRDRIIGCAPPKILTQNETNSAAW